jgi:hypothetical protein
MYLWDDVEPEVDVDRAETLLNGRADLLMVAKVEEAA